MIVVRSVEKRSFFRDVANMFDTFLVVAGLVDLVVSLLASDDQGAAALAGSFLS